MSNLLVPPFDHESAVRKVRVAEDAWNSRDPARIAVGYSIVSVWRKRGEFFEGRESFQEFLERKWQRELDYRLIKELWAYSENRIAVRFQYEWQALSGSWYRAYGNENWEFEDSGLMLWRQASINDVPIRDCERLFHWDAPGRRPDDHPGLAELESIASRKG